MAVLTLRLRTWIPQKEVLFSTDGFVYTYFKGDDRGPLWSTTDYRTSHAFSIDTSKSNYGLQETTKIVSASTILNYDSSHKLINSASNSSTTEGLSYSAIVKSDDNLYITVKCDAANKLIPLSPAINYEFVIKVTRAGSVRITGKHDGFPGYEFWRSISGKAKGPELVFSHNPVKTGETIASLAPPMEHDVDQGLGYDS